MGDVSNRRLPEEIYVRRRVAAVVVLLVVIGLVVWGLTAFANRGDEPEAPVAVETTTTESTTSTTASSEESTTETTAASTSEEPSEEPSETAVAAESKDTCELADLRITATSDRPSYGPNVQPTFYMTVANPTDADCEINLDDEQLRFEVYNLETNNRVWADTDCYPSVLSGDETFEAGDERSFQAVWSRLESQPGQCSNRTPVEPGPYFLHAVIGSNPSDAHPFNLG